MPLTLWRHLLIELVKMLTVTTAIIVTVIAFGATVKPLSDDSLGIQDVWKYVAMATIPMLQFALPFSAGFAATVVMHRMVTDNEIPAMSASGMSYRRILFPVAALGVALSLVMAVLLAVLVPQFWTRMKIMTTADATQLLVAAVRRGEALKAENLLIYADAIESVPPPEGSGALRRLMLRGVAAIELESKGSAQPATEFTAEAAAIDVYTADGGTIAKIALMNATVFRPSEGAIATVPYAEPEAASFDSSFFRSPKYLSLGDLLALRADVDRASTVQAARQKLALVLSEQDLWHEVLADLDAHGTVTLVQRNGERSFLVEDAALDEGTFVPRREGGALRVTELAGGRAARRTESVRAPLKAVTEVGFNPSMSLVVSSPLRTRDVAQNTTARWPPRVDDLQPTGQAPDRWADKDSDALLRASQEIGVAERRIPAKDLAKRGKNRADSLMAVRDAVRNDTDSNLAQRVAVTVSVALVMALGGVLAVWLRTALPLTVYLLAFLPAIGNIILIASGQQMMSHGYLASGLAVMWSGNAVLTAVLAAAWGRLSRN